MDARDHIGRAPAHGSEERPAPAFLLLIALTALGPFTMNAVIPAMPAIGRDFGVTYGTAQLTLTLYLVSVALSQLFLGFLSDRYGRRPVMIAGLLLFLVGTLICATAPTVAVLLAGRFVQAAGGSAGLVLTRVILQDLHGRDRAAGMIGHMTTAMVVSPMVAPLVGGALQELFGWRAIFWVLGALGLPALALACRHLHETRPVGQGLSKRPGLISRGSDLLARADFWAVTVNLSFASGMFFAFIAGAPYVVVEVMGRSPSEYGFYFMVASLGYMLGNFLTGLYAERAGPARMMAAGAAVAFCGVVLLLALAHVAHPLALFVPMTVIALSNGLTMPSALASVMSLRPEAAGAASGLAGALQIGLGALITLLVGVTQDGTAFPTIAVMTVCWGVALAGLLAARRHG